MTGQSEEDAWRSIVENYGDRPQVEPLPPAPEPEPAWRPSYDREDEGDDRDDEVDAADRFVPPTPEAPRYPTGRRLVAWLGVLGSPAILLVALVLALPMPSWVGYGLVAWFVGGFGWLVLHMDREPRDPWDNGARV